MAKGNPFPKKMKSSGPGARGVSNADVDKASGKGAGVGRPAFKKGGFVPFGKKKGKK